MPYSEKMEKRIDGVVRRWKGLEKKKMFGGVCYLVKGNMCFGIYKDYLILRVGHERALEKLKERHVRPFDITGRPMKGWVMVAEKSWENEGDMKKWLDSGRQFARGLSAK